MAFLTFAEAKVSPLPCRQLRVLTNTLNSFGIGQEEVVVNNDTSVGSEANQINIDTEISTRTQTRTRPQKLHKSKKTPPPTTMGGA